MPISFKPTQIARAIRGAYRSIVPAKRAYVLSTDAVGALQVVAPKVRSIPSLSAGGDVVRLTGVQYDAVRANLVANGADVSKHLNPFTEFPSN